MSAGLYGIVRVTATPFAGTVSGQLRRGVTVAGGSSESHSEYSWSIDQMDDFA